VQRTPDGKSSFTSIPVIDISKIDSAKLDDRKAIAQELYDSCSTSGFFYIVNHGVCLTTDPPWDASNTH
jgi:isopenicillin N synthase-like dioxygenase